MWNATISVYEFWKLFPHEETARMCLEQQRWGDKPQCLTCETEDNQHKQKRRNSYGYYRCHHCKLVYSVRTGTIFERSHVPLG